MNEAKRKRIMYAVFILAILWGLYMQPWKRQQRNAPDPAVSESVAAAAILAPVSISSTELQQVAFSSDWSIDPFRPSGPREADEPEEQPVGFPGQPVLQGTMTVGGIEVCVLDGQVWKTGDRRGSWRIAHIGKGEVTLIGPNEERVILTTR